MGLRGVVGLFTLQLNSTGLISVDASKYSLFLFFFLGGFLTLLCTFWFDSYP